jgi:hypothetical protein
MCMSVNLPERGTSSLTVGTGVVASECGAVYEPANRPATARTPLPWVHAVKVAIATLQCV